MVHRVVCVTSAPHLSCSCGSPVMLLAQFVADGRMKSSRTPDMHRARLRPRGAAGPGTAGAGTTIVAAAIAGTTIAGTASAGTTIVRTASAGTTIVGTTSAAAAALRAVLLRRASCGTVRLHRSSGGNVLRGRNSRGVLRGRSSGGTAGFGLTHQVGRGVRSDGGIAGRRFTDRPGAGRAALQLEVRHDRLQPQWHPPAPRRPSRWQASSRSGRS